jgi:hypothetical protein
MHNLLYGREDIYWLSLLSRYRDSLKIASDAMEEAVNDDGTTALVEIRKCFNEFFRQYANCFVWFAEVRQREKIDDSFLGAPGDLQRWLGAHRKFRRALWNLSQRPEHKGQIANEIQNFDRRAYAELEHPIDGAFDSATIPGEPVVVDLSDPSGEGQPST